MGTFEHSAIRKARKPRKCVCCRIEVAKGERYLSYAIGLRNHLTVRLACGAKDPAKWRCAALLEELKRQ